MSGLMIFISFNLGQYKNILDFAFKKNNEMDINFKSIQ
jgi:hypothetical protein